MSPAPDARGAGTPGADRPTPASASAPERHPVLSVVAGVLRANLRLDAALVLTVALGVVSALLPPLVLEAVVNDLTQGRGDRILRLAVAYLALVALNSLAGAARETAIVAFGQRVTHAMRSRMARKLGTLPSSYFAAGSSGALTSRFVNDVDTVEALFASGVVSMFSDACTVAGVVAVVFTRSLGLGLLLLLAVPALFAWTRYTQRRSLAAQSDLRRAVAQANRQIPETIACLRSARLYGARRFMAARYDRAVQAGFSAMERSNLFDALYSPVVMTVSALVVAVTVSLSATGGAMQSLFGMSVGTAVAIVSYVRRAFMPLDSIGMEIQQVQESVAGVRRVSEFLRETEMPEAQLAAIRGEVPPRTPEADAPAVELSGVCFAYPDGTPVLDGFDLSVARGEHVTLAGRTGAGKSTVMKLMVGLHRPQEGSVRVLGTEPDMVPAALRRRVFGYVEQGFRMVTGTVAQQVSLSDPAIGGAQVENALRLVGLDRAVAALPLGQDTPCDQAALSQGQLQLLSIARAVACDPAVLLLDEITANLDSATERQVMAAIKRASRDRTVVSISHRLYEQTGGRIVWVGEEPGR